MHSILQQHFGWWIKIRLNVTLFRLISKYFLCSSKRRFLLVVSFIFTFGCTTLAFGAFEDFYLSARSGALAGAGAAWSLGAESIFINPAATCSQARLDASACYTSPFGLEGLYSGAVAGCLSYKKIGLGGAVKTFGTAVYRENEILLNLAFRASNFMDIGGNLRGGFLSIAGYGSAATLLVDLGVIVHIQEHIEFGAFMKNASFSTIGRARESLPQIFSSGIKATLTPNVNACLDLYKDARFPSDIRGGIEYTVAKTVCFRIGTGTNPSRVAAGFSLKVSLFRLDYAYAFHNELGATHLFVIGFEK